MGIALMIVGGLVALVGGIGVLIAAFRESVGWGIGCLVVPLVSLIFVVMHWEETKKPFLLNVAGSIVMVVGAVISGPSGPMD